MSLRASSPKTKSLEDKWTISWSLNLPNSRKKSSTKKPNPQKRNFRLKSRLWSSAQCIDALLTTWLKKAYTLSPRGRDYYIDKALGRYSSEVWLFDDLHKRDPWELMPRETVFLVFQHCQLAFFCWLCHKETTKHCWSLFGPTFWGMFTGYSLTLWVRFIFWCVTTVRSEFHFLGLSWNNSTF